MFAKSKGGEVESQLRARYSLDSGLNFEPACASHDEFPWLIASYDGVAEEEGRLSSIEIKFVGLDVYNSMNTVEDLKLIKPAHYCQCQHQMMPLDLNFVDYLFSVAGISYKRIRVHADAKMQARIFSACQDFSQNLILDLAPGLTEQDWWPALPALEKLLQEPFDDDKRQKIRAAMAHTRHIGSNYKCMIDKRGALRITKLERDT